MCAEYLPPISKADIEEKQELIHNVLSELAKEDLINPPDYLPKFNKIYEGNYRQMYSALQNILAKIDKDPDCKVELICDNLEEIREYLHEHYEEETNAHLFSKIFKLSDHINLEVQRLRSVDRLTEQIKNNYNSLNNNLLDASKKMNDLEKQVNKAEERTSRLQIETVSILAIFAAIVIAFSGGASFLGSSLSSLSGDAALPNIVCLTSLCGLVLFNIIVLLTIFIRSILGSNKSLWGSNMGAWLIVGAVNIVLLVIFLATYFGYM